MTALSLTPRSSQPQCGWRSIGSEAVPRKHPSFTPQAGEGKVSINTILLSPLSHLWERGGGEG